VSDIDLRYGRYQDVLADVKSVAFLCADPPYSVRTEKGFRTGVDVRDARGMGYRNIDGAWASSFVGFWTSRVNGFWAVCCDHVAFPWWETAMGESGLYTFPPVVIVKNAAPPRMAGDGPSSQCEYISVGRPRRQEFMGTGARPGWYMMETVRHGHDHCGVSGAKSPDLMRAIVRDYSRPGDLVCDPCAGGGTTAIACLMEGRRFVGAEMDPVTYAKAAKRIDDAQRQAHLFEPRRPKPKQGKLL